MTDSSTNVKQLRARALASAGRLAHFQSDFPAARHSLQEALSLFRQTGDEMGAVSAMSTLMVILTWQGEIDEAVALLGEGLTLLPSVQARADSLGVLSEFAWAASHISAPQALADARALNEIVIERAREEHDKHSLGLGLACLGQCFYWLGDWDMARVHFEESVPLLRGAGALWMLEYALWALGQSVLQQGDLESAREVSSEAMLREREVETWIGAPYYLETFAFLAALQNSLRRAVQLLSAAAAFRTRHHSVAQPFVTAQTERYLVQLRTAISSDEFAVLWKQRQTLCVQEAIHLALEGGTEEVAA